MTYKVEIFKEYNLGKYLKIVLENNEANNLPYHNLYHTLCVAYNSYKIAVPELLTEEKVRVQILAALFHDFNHSGGKLKDAENVKVAISKFLEYSEESDEVNNQVVDIIKATEYPYVIAEEDLTFEQKIIRDADMMQCYTDNYLQQVVLGLGQEMKLDLKTALSNQPKFWSNTKFYTNYAKEVSSKILKHIVQDIEWINSL